QANGETIIKDAEELRIKETDRIKAVYETLSILGANVIETEDGLIIKDKTTLTGGKIKDYGDHRMAMIGIIASLISRNNVTLERIDSINMSYSEFIYDLNKLI